MNAPIVEFDPEKSRKIRKERGLGFEELVTLIEGNGIVADFPHPNQAAHKGQDIWYVDVDDYIWSVIHIKKGGTARLITAFPNRKATAVWKKEKHHDHKKK